MGYVPVVYFCNPNLDTKEEFIRRLEAQKTVCEYHKVDLIVEEYNPNDYLSRPSDDDSDKIIQMEEEAKTSPDQSEFMDESFESQIDDGMKVVVCRDREENEKIRSRKRGHNLLGLLS